MPPEKNQLEAIWKLLPAKKRRFRSLKLLASWFPHKTGLSETPFRLAAGNFANPPANFRKLRGFGIGRSRVKMAVIGWGQRLCPTFCGWHENCNRE